MKVRIVHPDGLVAVAGHDHALGWYIEVRDQRGRLREEYDGLTHGEPTSLQGVLEILVQHGFITKPELEYGLAQIHFGFDPEDVEGDGARRAATLVQQLKQAAGE